MILTLILVVAAAVGVFIFVKNNPKKTEQIDQTAKTVISKVEDTINSKKQQP